MARMNIYILGISEVKWNKMGKFNSGDHSIYYHGQESLRRNGVALTVNKIVRNAILGCNLKNDSMISVHFQGKPFNIIVSQVFTPTTNTEEVDLNGSMKTYKTFRTNSKLRCRFHHRGLECKSRKSRNTWSNRKVWPWSMKWSMVQANRVLSRERKHPLPTAQEITWTSPDGQYWDQIHYILCSWRWRSSIQSAKTRLGLTVAHILKSLLQNSGWNWKK